MPNGHDDHAWDYQEEIAQLTRRLEAMRSARANDAQDMQQLRAQIDHLRALLREVQDLIPDYWDGRYDELCDRIDAALEGRDARL